MKFFLSKRRTLAAAAVLLLLLFLFRPGASRLKSRIIVSISSAVGRSVDISSVHIRLLPRPGFDLQNLVVYDDPAFGAEPMLRAGEVTAALRLTSLLRGRIEIARLDLTEPSLNLVHADNGRWNLEALLERTAHMPLAPTAKAKLEPRPAFPYIAAISARINFKNGPEKRPFALTNADFSLWQDSENTWGVRLIAQPVRTDLSLNDTGLLQLNGTWQRAATLRETPVNVRIEWTHAQLGQLTKLFTRNDQGWRGGVDLAATLIGTPAALAINSSLTVQDFRRFDINNGEPLRLAAHCDGQYSSIDHTFHQVVCNAPIGNGLIAVKGDVGLPGSHRSDLVLIAENVPASALVMLAQRAKKNLPEDLTAEGVVHGSVKIYDGVESGLQWEGQGEVSDFRLASVANKSEFGPESIPFAFADSAAESGRTASRKRDSSMRFPTGSHVEIGPFPLTAGRSSTSALRGWIDLSGYSFSLAGEAEIGRTLRASRMLGLPALASTADGQAQLSLQIAGQWPGWGNDTHATFLGPQITGSVKLHNVRVPVRGVEEPVEISSAELQLGPQQARVEKLVATVAGAAWSGSLALPRGCGAPGACEVHFNLKADRIALTQLSEWASPRAKTLPWYHVLEASTPAPPSWRGNLRGSGHIATDRFEMHALVATHVSASVNLDRGKLQIADLRADFLGGHHLGTWKADYSVKPALCGGSGSLDELQLARLSGETEPDISGTADGTYQVSGPCAASFWTDAQGVVDFDLRDGALTHISLVEDGGSLKFSHFSGQAHLIDGQLETKNAKLDSTSGRFLLSGTASLQHSLDVKLARGATSSAGGYAITGTLAEPEVKPLPGSEQAQLKPEAAK